MSFADDLKRSLGFEEDENGSIKNNGPRLGDKLRDLLQPRENQNRSGNNPNPQYQSRPQAQYSQAPRTAQRPAPRQAPSPTPAYDDFDDFVIIPEQSYYEIVLIRPKTIDDINYVVDQVIEEQNPVIVDLSFLEKESAPNFKLAGDKIKQMRERYSVQALLLSRTEDKNLIIITPKKVKVVNKG